eukprot:TRINITY_DN9396_c0_g1_i1.p1 TRINITY_DN9396_c0_g1~~TRINITY_DN9396_c0_g1_i1.p1  ORF type:complete len:253 (-),score=41.14 TRINITY_DN9396_c0_g1_i1:93-851(-)
MALVDIGDSWERELESAEKLHQNALSLIGDRGKYNRSSSIYLQLTDDLRRTLAQFKQQVARLSDKLNAEQQSLTSGEKSRREGIVDSLSRKERDLKELVSKTSFRDVDQDKRNLFRKPVPGGGVANLGKTGWGDVERGGGGDGDGEESRDTAGLSAQALRDRREEALADQDAGLDALHSVILRQKNMAQQIGTEIHQQNDIIDEIDDRLDNTTQRLLDNTARVRTVGRKDTTCAYWVIIIILLIAIIVVAVA